MIDKVPDNLDFMSAYDCVSYYDDDLILHVNFANSDFKMTISTDTRDYIFIIISTKDSLVVSKTYEEGVASIVLLKDSIKVTFENNLGIFDDKHILINVFPNYSIDSVTLLS